MSGRGGERQLQTEGQGLDIPAKLKMPAAEATERIARARRTVDAFTSRFVRKDFPERLGEAARRDFDEGISVENLAGSLGIKLHGDRREKSGASRKILFGEIGETPVVLSTSVYSDRPGYPDREGRIEVWVRAVAEGIPEVSRAIWPILGYGNISEQTYLVEPEVPKEQFLGWGGPDSMREIVWNRERHPEAMRAFFSCFTQAIQFLEAAEFPAKGGMHLIPRDFAKGHGNAIWESSGSKIGEGKLRIRDLGLWQVASPKTPDLEFLTLACQWAAINQFLGSNIGGVFGTNLKFSEVGKDITARWTDSRFRSQKPYLKSLSKALGGEADLVGFVDEWNGKVSPLIQRISQSPVSVGDESLPAVPGYSGMVYTGSPIELIEGVLENHGLWFPARAEIVPVKEGRPAAVSVEVLPAVKKPRKRRGLPRKRGGEIIPGKRREKEGKMGTPEKTGQTLGLGGEIVGVERQRKAEGLAEEIRRQAVIGRLYGKFSPLIRTRNEAGELERLDNGRTNQNETIRGALIALLAGSADGRTGYDSVRWFGRQLEDWQRRGYNWEWVADGECFDSTKVEKRWYGLSERESRDYFELQPLQGENVGFSRIYYVFSQSGASAMETRRNVDQFSVVVPNKLADEIWEAVKVDPQLPLALIHAAYPGSGTPMVNAEILEAMKKYKLGDKLPDEKILALIKSASVIERRAPLTGVYMVDCRQHDLAAISDAAAFLREAYAPVPEVKAVEAPVATERKLPEIKVDGTRLIDPQNKTVMQGLAEAANLLSEYQRAGGLPESVKRAGDERDAFIKSMRNLRGIIYHLDQGLQRKVLLAALGEEEPGMSLVEQFDRELDRLLLSWGVDLLK